MITASKQHRIDYRRTGHWGELTLADMFHANVARYPEREAVVDPSNRASFTFGTPARLNYRQLRDEVDRVAACFVAQGVGKDDIVFVQLPNIFELLVVYFACAEIGAIISPIPVVYREHELRALQATAKPKAYVFAVYDGGVDFHAMALAVFDQQTVLMAFGEFVESTVSSAKLEERGLINLSTSNPGVKAERALVNADDIFTLCWTSGTTGTPKGVPRSHNHWASIAPIISHAAGLQKHDVLLNPFPLVNMGAIGGVIMSWLLGAGTIVLHQPFDLKVFMQQVLQERPHFTLAPPAILNMLLADEALAKSFESTSLRSIASGSAPLAPSMVKGFQDRFGIGIVNVFGSNEGMSMASGPANVEDPALRASYFPANAVYPTMYDAHTPADCCAHIQMRLVNVESGELIQGDGESGELEITGPTVFEGYFNASSEKQDSFTADGYFKTGDLFEYAHKGQQLKFIGRCKDLIIRGGVNIAPEEIDQLLSGHPALIEVCSFGVPHDILGEKVAVAVVVREQQTVALSDLCLFLQERGVAKHKWPEFIIHSESLPRNAMNKLMRQEVRDSALLEITEGETNV